MLIQKYHVFTWYSSAYLYFRAKSSKGIYRDEERFWIIEGKQWLDDHKVPLKEILGGKQKKRPIKWAILKNPIAAGWNFSRNLKVPSECKV